MAHNLNTANGQVAMAYNAQGGMPWHGLGQSVDGAMTAEEALVKGGLNYEIEKVDIFSNVRNPQTNDIDIVNISEYLDKVSVIRKDTMQPLGVVGRDYQVLQNREAFGFLDSLVGENQAVYETVGALGLGEKVWMMLKLPHDIEVNNGKDISKCYLLMYNAHDGTSTIKARFTPIRVVCQNTVRMALQGKSEVSIRHTVNALERLEEAHKLLGIVKKQVDYAQVIFNKMAHKRVNPLQIKQYLDAVITKSKTESNEPSTRRENIVNEIVHLFKAGKGNNGETVWDLYNGVTEYVDHHRSVKNGGNKWVVATFGTGDPIKQRAFEFAVELADA